MALPLDEILSITENKYELAVVAMQYARYLIEKNNGDLSITRGGKTEKITLIALRETLQHNVPYEFNNK